MTRLGWALLTVFISEAVGATALLPPRPILIWNASPSAPIGLYALHPESRLRRGELLAIQPPPELARFLADRRYLAPGVPLLKRVAALPGQSACRNGRSIFVDGRASGEALERDRRGRALPVWRGCRRITPDQVFVLNPAWDSLDSRYFGPLPTTGILGRAVPLWTRARS